MEVRSVCRFYPNNHHLGKGFSSSLAWTALKGMTTRGPILARARDQFPIYPHIAQAEPVDILHHVAIGYPIKCAI